MVPILELAAHLETHGRSVPGHIAALVGTYLAFFWVVANPTSPLAVVLSLLPPFAPVLMASRIATGDAAGLQVLVAVALMVVAIVAMNRLAARIYVNSVLRVGSRVAWSRAWRGAE
jgi:ABC-2 type transport system permease protein